jgi:type I restriction enzyme M protein
MLTTATKRKIDTARDILVGKIPVPTSQVEQITLALVYKFMSDMDKKAKDLGDSSGFFANGYEKYAWGKLMDKALPARDRVLLYREALEKMSLNPHIPQLFRDVFRDASLPFNDPETLKLFLDVIDQFEYDHSEELGNAFEYLLQVMGSQGDAGQFRTPRHIIDFIVDVVEPSKTDKILDPACGTAGFLISAYNHIKKNGLSADEMTQLSENFVGYDISQDMQRLSLVNMYLHHFPNPHIYEYDTLTSEDRWNDDFDVILANPPFMTPKGGIRPHNRFSVPSKRAEVLFVDYIMEHLTARGKAGVIVPEGITFTNQEAYKNLRKMMIENGYLWAVISLPSGVFQPYSGVKTSILLFDKTIANSKNNESILFVKVENDGFDLGSQRRENNKNDLPKTKELLLAYKKAVLAGNNLDGNEISKLGGALCDKKQMHNYDYDLDVNHQIELDQAVNKAYDELEKKWSLIKIGDLFEMVNGRAFKKEEWNSLGLPIIRIANLNDEQASFNYFDGTFDEKILVKRGDLLFSWSGTKGTSFGPHIWKKENGVLNQHIFKFVPKEYEIDTKFAYYFIKSIVPEIESQAHGTGGLVHITKTKLQNFQIPLPPIDIQIKIVSEIDRYQKIIDGAKQIVENYQPEFQIDDGWEWKKLSELCELISDGTHQTPTYSETGTIFLSSRNVTKRKVDWDNIKFIPEKLHLELQKRISPKLNDVLLAKNGTTGVAAIVDRDIVFDIYVSLAVLRPSNKVLPLYLLHLVNSPLAKKQFNSRLHGVGVPNLHLREIKEVKIPVPPLEIQQDIVSRIENEMRVIDENVKFIELYKKKISAKIDEIWKQNV